MKSRDKEKRIDPKTVHLHEKQYREMEKMLTEWQPRLLGSLRACQARHPDFAQGAVMLIDALEETADKIKFCVLLPKALENSGVSVNFDTEKGTALEIVQRVAAVSLEGASN
jgi:hypothetical protein